MMVTSEILTCVLEEAMDQQSVVGSDFHSYHLMKVLFEQLYIKQLLIPCFLELGT